MVEKKTKMAGERNLFFNIYGFDLTAMVNYLKYKLGKPDHMNSIVLKSDKKSTITSTISVYAGQDWKIIKFPSKPVIISCKNKIKLFYDINSAANQQTHRQNNVLSKGGAIYHDCMIFLHCLCLIKIKMALGKRKRIKKSGIFTGFFQQFSDIFVLPLFEISCELVRFPALRIPLCWVFFLSWPVQKCP